MKVSHLVRVFERVYAVYTMDSDPALLQSERCKFSNEIYTTNPASAFLGVLLYFNIMDGKEGVQTNLGAGARRSRSQALMYTQA